MSDGRDIEHNHSAGSWMCPACERNEAMADLDKIAGEWLAARAIIVRWLDEISPADEEWLEHNAAALLARLAHHNPPLLLTTYTDLAAAEKREAKLRAENKQLRRVEAAARKVDEEIRAGFGECPVCWAYMPDNPTDEKQTRWTHKEGCSYAAMLDALGPAVGGETR